jgi:hypothetical protein
MGYKCISYVYQISPIRLLLLLYLNNVVLPAGIWKEIETMINVLCCD